MSEKTLIVGAGLAGTLMAWELIKRNKEVELWDNQSQSASRVAAGMFNPVSFKRLVEVWDAEENMNFLHSTYTELEEFLGIKVLNYKPILRVFPHEQYKILWQKRLNDNHPVSKWLSEVKTPNDAPRDVIADSGFGLIEKAGWVNLPLLLDSMKAYLSKKGKFKDASWSHGDEVNFDRIIDCRGVGCTEDLAQFNLQIKSDHGEVLTVSSPSGAPELNDMCVNRVKWLLPRGDGSYRLGATYAWDREVSEPSPEGLHELTSAIRPVLTPSAFNSLQVDLHESGFRPASKDRRPYAGALVNSIYTLSGLGTRGVLIGPRTAHQLANHIFEGKQLPSEVNTNRY